MSFDPAGLALWLAVFLLSTTCHEAAHAAVAYWGGDPTAYRAGQVSLNPWPHIRREPFGMVIVPLLTYIGSGWMLGWASAPYDPYWADRHPRRSALMALAGPSANLVLAGLGLLGIHLLVGAGMGQAPDTAGFERIVEASRDGFMVTVARLLSILTVLNALLGVFNLIPLPPLDGGSVARVFGGPLGRMLDLFQSYPLAAFAGLLIAWRLFDLIAPFVFRAVLLLAHPEVRYGG